MVAPIATEYHLTRASKSSGHSDGGGGHSDGGEGSEGGGEEASNGGSFNVANEEDESGTGMAHPSSSYVQVSQSCIRVGKHCANFGKHFFHTSGTQVRTLVYFNILIKIH